MGKSAGLAPLKTSHRWVVRYPVRKSCRFYPLRLSASTSAKSWSLPAASLFLMRCSFESTQTPWSANFNISRSAQASSNPIPSIAVRTAIRMGSTPNLENDARALKDRLPLDRATEHRMHGGLQSLVLRSRGEGRTQTSKSRVARTCPCAANAWAPTKRNSTCRALNSANRSLKSWFTAVI